MDQSAPHAMRDESPPKHSDAVTTLHVCVTCRAGEDGDAGPRPGRRLYDALIDAQRTRTIRRASASSRSNAFLIAIAAAASC